MRGHGQWPTTLKRGTASFGAALASLSPCAMSRALRGCRCSDKCKSTRAESRQQVLEKQTGIRNASEKQLLEPKAHRAPSRGCPLASQPPLSVPFNCQKLSFPSLLQNSAGVTSHPWLGRSKLKLLASSAQHRFISALTYLSSHACGTLRAQPVGTMRLRRDLRGHSAALEKTHEVLEA